jgi:hypothetical protein
MLDVARSQVFSRKNKRVGDSLVDQKSSYSSWLKGEAVRLNISTSAMPFEKMFS